MKSVDYLIPVDCASGAVVVDRSTTGGPDVEDWGVLVH